MIADSGLIPEWRAKLKAGDVRLKSSEGWSLPRNRYTAQRRSKLPKLHIPRLIMDCAAKSEQHYTIPFGAWAEAKRKAKTGGLLTHQLRTKCARQGFTLSSHMLVVSPVPKRDRNNPLRRVFSCLQYVNCVLVLVSQLRKERLHGWRI